MLKIPLLFSFAQHPQRALFRWLRKVKFFLAFCTVLFAHGLTTEYVAAQLQNGLVGYWSFDDGTGTIASDSSGNGNTATLINGPSWVTAGEVAGALSFDGVDDYVSFASQPQGTLSVSAWVYAQATPGNLLPRIIDMPGYVLYLAEPGASNPMSLGFISRRSTQDGKWTTPANSLAYDTWNHVAVVYDSSSTLNNPDLYINGVKQTISTITSPQGTQTLNGGTGIIGNRIPLDRGWKGIIDELRVYNRALSASEIVSLYDQGNSGPFNFSLANSMSLSATQGSSATNTIRASLVSGSSQPVSFSASGLPSGASASFSQKTCSPTCSSLLTIATAASTPTGASTITVSGTGGGVTKTTSFTLTVNSSAPTFNFSLSNDGNKSVTQGQSIASNITATLSTGTSQAVAFSTAGLPTGATASYSTSASCNPTCSRTLNIATAASTPTGTYTITVTGTGGGVTKTTSFTLTVNSSAPTFNFSLSNDGNKSVTQGQSIASNITATLSTGTSQAVAFSTAGLPTGATASYSTSASCNPTCSRTLNIATATSTPTGTYTITVTGTGGGVTKTTSFTLTVNSPTGSPPSPPSGNSISTNIANGAVLSGSSVVWTATPSGSPVRVEFFIDGALLWTEYVSPYQFNGDPSGTLDTNTLSNGSHQLKVRATYSDNSTAEKTITVTASNGATPTPAQLTLTWQDNSTNEDNFAIERKTGSSGTYTQITLVTANSPSYLDTTVVKGINYCYRVRAVNSAGASAYTNEACKTVP